MVRLIFRRKILISILLLIHLIVPAHRAQRVPMVRGPMAQRVLQATAGPKAPLEPMARWRTRPRWSRWCAIGGQGPTGPAGLMCWDLNANGQADLPAEDVNLDTFVNTLDCAGPEGATGADGTDGTDGAGAGWRRVVQVPAGPQGLAGADGANGATGADGAPGPQGAQGARWSRWCEWWPRSDGSRGFDVLGSQRQWSG